VAAALTATVVFNAIDIGVIRDFCVTFLCKELELPISSGQSFAWKFMTEFYTSTSCEVCAFCHESTLSTFAASDSAVRGAGGILDRLTAFLTSTGQGGSGVGCEELLAFLEVDKQFRCCGDPQGMRDLVTRSLKRIGLDKLKALGDIGLADDLLSFLRKFNDEVVECLAPGAISSLPNLLMIPRPVHVSTRYIGSWVCPCLACSVLMVSQWCSWLTRDLPEGEDAAPRIRNPPQSITFNLDDGMTSDEQLGYELGALGMAPDIKERRFSREKSNPSCKTCAAAKSLRAAESLFFGRLPVVFAPVPGQTLCPPACWPAPPGPADGVARKEAAERALARRKPLSHLGEAYAQVVVPALPAVDWERGEKGEKLAESNWPPELSTMPLLKVPEDSGSALLPSALHGVASGIRSGIVRARGRWWRLKGCGNRSDGFPVEVKGDQGELNVRGCTFEHTTNTELRMTSLATEALAKVGLDAANRPAGSYRYKPDPAWPLPLVERQCVVFETFGNARMGDHLIAGILQLLPNFVPVTDDGFAALRAAIFSGRGGEGSGMDANELWATEMVTSCGMPTADVAKQLQTGDLMLGEGAPSADAPIVENISADLHGVWQTARTGLAQRIASAKSLSREPSLLLWLAWRLGWECGTAVRGMHAAGIAWGTYADVMGIHCNAHVNNLVIKPLGFGNDTSFLAALDFDMAFTRESFLQEATVSHSSMGLDSWEGVLNFEATMGMKTVLAGSDFASTGVANAVSVPASHALVEMAVRDTLVAAYDSAFTGRSDTHPHHPAMREAAYDMIKLSLACTTHVEG